MTDLGLCVVSGHSIPPCRKRKGYRPPQAGKPQRVSWQLSGIEAIGTGCCLFFCRPYGAPGCGGAHYCGFTPTAKFCRPCGAFKYKYLKQYLPRDLAATSHTLGSLAEQSACRQHRGYSLATGLHLPCYILPAPLLLPSYLLATPRLPLPYPRITLELP